MTIFFSIKVHFQGVFINKPFCYSDGVHHMFENIYFTGMSYNEYKCEKLHYCEPDLQIPEDIAYRCRVQLPVYMDHFGTIVHATKEHENEDNF
uniref:Uncharacterized protein n=1 Tax=Lactuca sativa TaxID=4236 RepID=A0A9R1UX87_LACSA|nr:hypothetical protein LSAT_V11C800401470 [Lactuca sativa]